MDIGDVVKVSAYWIFPRIYKELGIIIGIHNHGFEHRAKLYVVWFFVDQRCDWIFSNEMSKV